MDKRYRRRRKSGIMGPAGHCPVFQTAATGKEGRKALASRKLKYGIPDTFGIYGDDTTPEQTKSQR
jgi:hypothetical protein